MQVQVKDRPIMFGGCDEAAFVEMGREIAEAIERCCQSTLTRKSYKK